MVLLLAIQLMVLNSIHLFGYATPLLIGYVIIRFRCSSSRISLLLFGFVTGLIFDLFSNTMGIGAASMTLLAFVQPILLDKFMSKDETDKFRPTIRTMGLVSYSLYALTSFLILHLAFYILEAFSMANFWLTFAAIITGSLVATALTLLIELIWNDRKAE